MKNAKFEPFLFEKKQKKEMIKDSEDFYRTMKTRRSIRAFSEEMVPEEVIRNAILSAGTSPSGANMQPWHFVVVSNPETKKKIREAAEEIEKEFYHGKASDEWLDALTQFGTDEYKPFLETAPYLIAVFLKKITVDEEGIEHKNYYTSESVGIATGVLISALHHSGLATLTHTPSPMNFLNDILDRPKTERPFLLVISGYPKDGVEVPVITKYNLDKIATFE